MNFGEVHYPRDRLRYPLLRKGSGWAKISYEDALEVLASNLQTCKEKYGPESVVFYKGESASRTSCPGGKARGVIPWKGY